MFAFLCFLSSVPRVAGKNDSEMTYFMLSGMSKSSVHLVPAVDVLVDLLTLEAQCYGEQSMVGTKVVEYVPMPQPAAGTTVMGSQPATGASVMGPPVRPQQQPVQPAPPALASNTHVQPSKQMFYDSNNDLAVASNLEF